MNSIKLPYNYEPRTYQIPILKALDGGLGGKKGGVTRAIAVWHRRCLAEHTMIAMASGRYKKIQNVGVDDMVLSFDGNCLIPRRVTGVFKNGETVVKKFNDLWATPNHKVWSKGRYRPIGSASSLTNAGVLAFGEIHDPELGELLGLLLSDGSVQINQTPKFTNTDDDLISRFQHLVKSVFPQVLPKLYSKGNGFDVLCPTETKTNYHPIRKYFDTSNTMPEIVWDFDKETTLAFLSGVISGDGSIWFKRTETPRGYNCLTGSLTIEAGISRKLARDYKNLLLKFGIRSKIKKDSRSRNHRVFVYSLRNLASLDGIKIYSKKKHDRLYYAIKETGRFNKFKSEKIKYEGESQTVDTYDLTIEGEHNYIANGYIVHNSGKDKTMLNFIAKRMYQRVGSYFYLFPTYTQGRKVLWEGMDSSSFKFIDHIPEALRASKNEQQMKIEMENGSIFRIIGTDRVNSIMGTNPVGCVFSEYALQDPAAWDYLRPILAENNGWAAFIFTPRGKNHGYDLLELAQQSDDWFTQILDVTDTKAIPESVLEQERKEIIKQHGNDGLYQQEYLCSFDVPVQGAYYATQMTKAEEDGRISGVPYVDRKPVHTAWDLGIDDSMSIWFFQVVGKEYRFIDFYESQGEGLKHYKKKLDDKDYVYGEHHMPHDVKVRELGTGKSRYEVAKSMGIRPIRVAPKLPREDGIEACRRVLGQCWFDKERCSRGISALRSYRKKWDEENKVFKKRPVHDFASHGADAFRTFSTSFEIPSEKDSEGVEFGEDSDPYSDPSKVVV